MSVGVRSQRRGKPLIQLYETPAGTPPALKIVYYPGDTWGYEFAYPVEQAKQLAAVAHQPILATNSNAKTTTVPTLVFVQPDGTVTPDSRAVGASGASEPQPIGTTGNSDDDAIVAP